MTDFSFLGFEFSTIRRDDRRLLTDFLNDHPQRLAGYTFAALAAWSSYYRYGWTFPEPGTLLISCIIEPDTNRHLLQPVGPLSSELARTLSSRAADQPYPMKIVGVADTFVNTNPEFVKSFSFVEDRDFSNYLYSSEDLAQLSGRKYAKKRNLLSQASAQYSWTCHPLSPDLIAGCFAVLDSISREEHPPMEGMLKREVAALQCTLRNFEEFQQQGLLLTVADRPVAFSIYEPIGPEAVAIHFERALRSYKGLYQVVNWETSKLIAAQGFKFINREEDLGNPGLRDAKKSYHPVEIIPSYELTRLPGRHPLES